MALPRRLLPSVSLLTAFEAVVRTGSTLAAARDLDLTQSAVSRLIQSLEAQLGVQLFRREGRRLQPTDTARAYAAEVARALDLLSRASMKARAAPGGGALSLAILPTFGTRWLAPRLPRFQAQHPGITLSLGTRLRPFDFGAESFDAAIHFGEANWPDAGQVQLFSERLMACAAPGFLASHPIRTVQDLTRLPLLQMETRPDAWPDWLVSQGVTGRVPLGMLFDQFGQMIQAAIYGMGVALLPEYLARAELAGGRLAAAWGGAIPARGAYYLVWPHSAATYPPLLAFRDWLIAEAQGLGDDGVIAW